MFKRATFTTALTVGALTCVASAASAAQAMSAEDVKVITHEEAYAALDSSEIRKVFLGKMKKWPSGQRIVLACQSGGETHRVFLRRHVGKTPKQFRNFWLRQVFTGQGRMPKWFTDENTQVDFVREQPGAIGYQAMYFDPRQSRYVPVPRLAKRGPSRKS